MTKNAASRRAEDFIKIYYNCESSKPIDCIKDIDAFNLTLTSRFFLINYMSKKDLITSFKIKSVFTPVVDGKIFWLLYFINLVNG